MSEQAAHSRAGLFDRAQSAIGSAEALCWVPGRVEVLGKHVDYGGGRSLVAATEQGICVAARARRDEMLRVVSAQSGEVVECPLSEAAPRLDGWGNYISTVARRVARNFARLRGVEIGLVSDLPQASGLSSSSALMIGLFMAIDAINGIVDREPLLQKRESLAGYLGCVENGQSYHHLSGDRGVGTFGGSQDHTAILCCSHDHLSEFMYCPVRFDLHWPMPGELTFAIAYSGVHAAKAANALEQYNAASMRLARVLQIWNEGQRRPDANLMNALVRSSRNVELLRSRLTLAGDARLVDRFEQFAAETLEILPEARRAWFAGALGPFGEQVDRSQQLAERLLGNQVAETIALARTARERGAVAASAFGAGFGGSVWALVEREGAEGFLEGWRGAYLLAFPTRTANARFFVTRAGVAASVLGNER